MKTLKRLLVGVVLLVVVAGLAVRLHPLWVGRQITHFGLFTAHIQSNYVMTPEGRVHYYEAEPRFAPEHGIPLVLVHGLGDRSESWAPMMKRLKKAGFHVYAPDLMGYGRSPMASNGDYSMAAEEQFVVDFIQALGLPKTDIGGWSMGGWITMKLAVDHPDLVDRVVLYDAAGVREGQTIHDVGIFAPQSPAEMNKLFLLMEPEAHPLPGYVAEDARKNLEKQKTVVGSNLASMTDGKNEMDERIGQLKAPLLIVWGDRDLLTPLAVGEAIHKRVPASELDVVQGCGHLAANVCSARVAKATEEFLKANPVPMGQVRQLVR